jgi:Mor family transcriptional regulator
MSQSDRWKHNAKDLVERALLENPNGLTVKELSKMTGLKEDTVYKVLEKGEHPYEGYRNGKRIYFHLKYIFIQELKHTIILNVAKDILKKFHEEFVKSPAVVIYPFVNKIVAFDSLIAKVTEYVLKVEVAKKNKYKKLLNSCLTEEEIRRVVKETLEEKLFELDKYIKEQGLRIRIGGIDLF